MNSPQTYLIKKPCHAWRQSQERLATWLAAKQKKSIPKIELLQKVPFIGKRWYPWDGTFNNQPHIHLSIVGIYSVYPLLKGSWGVKQLGYHLKGTSIFPIIPGLFTRCSQIANVSKIGSFLWFCVQFTELSDHQESREPTFGGLGLVQKHPKPEEKNHRDLFATSSLQGITYRTSSVDFLNTSAKPGKWSRQCMQRLIPPYVYIYRTYGI